MNRSIGYVLAAALLLTGAATGEELTLGPTTKTGWMPAAYVMVEEGHGVPAIEVFNLSLRGQIRFVVTSGDGRFEGGDSEATYFSESGEIMLPAMESVTSDTVVRAEFSNVVLSDSIRLVTVSSQWFEESLPNLVTQVPHLLIAKGAHHAVMDQLPLHLTYPDARNRIFEREFQTKGAGRVCFDGVNGGDKGYSVYPENGGSLVCGGTSCRDADGLYREVWGCCTALKVPDFCTATVHSGGTYCSCPPWPFPQCSWVNPCCSSCDEAGWPNCPRTDCD